MDRRWLALIFSGVIAFSGIMILESYFIMDRGTRPLKKVSISPAYIHPRYEQTDVAIISLEPGQKLPWFPDPVDPGIRLIPPPPQPKNLFEVAYFWLNNRIGLDGIYFLTAGLALFNLWALYGWKKETIQRLMIKLSNT